MKKIVLISSFLMIVSLSTFASNNIVCNLIKVDSKEKVHAVFDLSKVEEEEYAFSNDSLMTSNDAAISFDMTAWVNDVNGLITVDIIFYENKHVQDEVGSTYFELDPEKTKKGKAVFVEPIEYQGQKVANMVCYHNI